jgi:hypothetical protein
MAYHLRAGDTRLTVETPGERYRFCRFDWNGLVSSVRYRGVELAGQEKPLFSRDARVFGRGFHNEFGIKKCVGYDGCAVGEWFPKIGTGWLKKDDKPYFFYNGYELDPLSFEHGASEDGTSATFACESGERNGYAYRYEKTVTCEPGGFAVSYRLDNVGSRAIETEEYCHNFLCFGGKRMDKGYELSFPLDIDRAKLVEDVDPDGILSISGSRITVTGKTRKQFYLGGVSGASDRPYEAGRCWTLSHEGLGLSLSESVSFAPESVHVWGWTSVVSPEAFLALRAAPGERVEWKRVYEVR